MASEITAADMFSAVCIEFDLTPKAAAAIRKRLDTRLAIYNAMLIEGLEQLDLCREASARTKARRNAKRRATRREALKAARTAWSWSEAGLTAYLQRYGEQFIKTQPDYHVEPHVIKILAGCVARDSWRYSLGHTGRT
jgi:hypothetical protein